MGISLFFPCLSVDFGCSAEREKRYRERERDPCFLSVFALLYQHQKGSRVRAALAVTEPNRESSGRKNGLCFRDRSSESQMTSGFSSHPKVSWIAMQHCCAPSPKSLAISGVCDGHRNRNSQDCWAVSAIRRTSVIKRVYVVWACRLSMQASLNKTFGEKKARKTAQKAKVLLLAELQKSLAKKARMHKKRGIAKTHEKTNTNKKARVGGSRMAINRPDSKTENGSLWKGSFHRRNL